MAVGGRRRLPGWIWPTLPVLATIVAMHGVFTTSRIFFFRDLGSYFWPHHVWLRRALRSGTLPLWDPNAGLGYASVADPALQLFFLPTLILRLLLPEVVGFNLGVALPLPLAAFGTYRFLRGHIPAPSAALGGLVYALSGPLLSAANCTNLAWCGALVPWVLRVVDRLRERPSARGLAALAALFACGICAGEPVTLAATGALAAAYAAFGGGGPRRWRLVVVTVAGGLLGLLLASVQVLPLVDATQRSIRGAGLLEDQWSLHPLLFAETMAPRLFGNYLGTLKEVGPWLRPLSGDRSPYLLSLYLGPGVLMLACLGAVAGRPRRWARFWTAAALAATVVSLGRYTPVYPFLQEALPLLRTFRYPAKYAIFSAFALAVATALGWRALTALARGRRGRALVAPTTSAALLGGAAATALVMVLLLPETTRTLATRLAAGTGLRDPVAGASFLAASLLAAAPRLLALASAGVACLWVGASRRREAPMARTALFILIGLDLPVTNADLNPTMDTALLREPSWTSALGEHPEDRVYITRELVPSARPLDPDLPPPPHFSPDVTAVLTLASYGSVLPAFPSAWGLREPIAEELTGLRPKEYLDLLLKYTWSDRDARTRFLVRAGTRYHLLPRPPSPDARALVLLKNLPPLALYEGPAPAPRVSVVPSGSVEPGVPGQIARLFEATFDPSAQVLLEMEPAPVGTPGEASHAWATIAAESPTEVLVQAAVPSPSAYLLLLDTYDPHWAAEVDGRPATLLRANGLFRAVRLVRGHHAVRFAYRSRPFQMGLTLSLLTALGLAAGAAVRGRRNPFDRGPSPGIRSAAMKKASGTADRLAREIEHHRAIASNAEVVWNWDSPAGRRRADRRAELFIEHGGLRPGVLALEFGCGTGIFLERVARSGADIRGIDLSTDLLAKARTRVEALSNVGLDSGNAEQLPYPDGAFDTVYGSSVLHHLDLDRALAEAFRVLHPGGRIAFAEPNILNPQVAFMFHVGFAKRRFGVSPDEMAFNRFRARAALLRAGFQDVTVTPFDFLHPAVPSSWVGGIERLSRILEGIPLVREIAGSLLIRGSKP